MLALFSLSLAIAAPDLGTPHRTGAKAPTDAAVVVGIEDYLRIPAVPHAAEDARVMADTLVYTVGIPRANVHLLEDQGSKEQIRSALEEAAEQVSPDGTLWVYFAGHGAADPSTGDRVLLGDDARSEPESFVARSIAVSEIHEVTGDTPLNLIVDACYSGLGRGGEQLSGKRFAVPAYATTAQPDHLEWNAAGPDELSQPLDAAGHGAFTTFVIGALRGWADGELSGERDGQVSAAEADAYVARGLAEVGIRDQHPELTGTRMVLSTGSEMGPADLSEAFRAAPEPVTAPVTTTTSTTRVTRDRTGPQRLGRQGNELVIRAILPIGMNPRGVATIDTTIADYDNDVVGSTHIIGNYQGFGVGAIAAVGYTPSPAIEFGGYFFYSVGQDRNVDANYNDVDSTSYSGGSGGDLEAMTFEYGPYLRWFPTADSTTRPFLGASTGFWLGNWADDTASTAEGELDQKYPWLIFVTPQLGLEITMTRRFDFVMGLDLGYGFGQRRTLLDVGDGAPQPSEADEGKSTFSAMFTIGFQGRSKL